MPFGLLYFLFITHIFFISLIFNIGGYKTEGIPLLFFINFYFLNEFLILVFTLRPWGLSLYWGLFFPLSSILFPLSLTY